MAVFREQVRETPTKYKMLWFVVDTYHGQRYFFICGCKLTVTKTPRKWGVGEPRSCSSSPPYFSSLCVRFHGLAGNQPSGVNAGPRQFFTKFAQWRRSR
jgi:hypothetical protein